MDSLTSVPIAYNRAVTWLWKRLPNGQASPSGSGVVITHANEQYLVTARHVAEGCDNQPLIWLLGQPVDAGLSVVASNPTIDITVLRSEYQLTPDSPQLGIGHLLYGAIGRALGFPQGAEDGIGELEGRPVPISVPISTNWRTGSDIQISGGYINSGFSGGAVLWPTPLSDLSNSPAAACSIAGIITHRKAVSRLVQRLENGVFAEHPGLAVAEPSGLFRFTSITAVTRLINESRNV